MGATNVFTTVNPEYLDIDSIAASVRAEINDLGGVLEAGEHPEDLDESAFQGPP